jgi:nicotinamide-nucleotide amidase
MAEGALHRSPAEVSVAVTGVAGPAPDEDGNPVGLVCIATTYVRLWRHRPRRSAGRAILDALAALRIMVDKRDGEPQCP